MSEKLEPIQPSELALRCHEMQVGLGFVEVPEFEYLSIVGMSVRLALHLRGLPLIQYDLLKLVAQHFLSIPPLAIRRIIGLLAEVEFVRLQTTGTTITGVLPDVPYYDDLYSGIGDYARTECSFTEAENLSVEIARRLAKAPENQDSLLNSLGAQKTLFDRTISIGTTGGYVIPQRARGRDMLINPHYFSENAEMYADASAAQGSKSVSQLLEVIRVNQGFPLGILESTGEIGGIRLSPEQIQFLRDLAKLGTVKPPMIKTSHSGENHFLFTPTPSRTLLSPFQKEVYEKAMAIVAAVRQGQYLAAEYAIRDPTALVNALRTRKRLNRATTEASEQYRNLVYLRIGRLVKAGGSYYNFEIIETQENLEALEIAYQLVSSGESPKAAVSKEARRALQQNQEYVESIIASSQLRQRQPLQLSKSQVDQLEFLFIGGNI